RDQVLRGRYDDAIGSLNLIRDKFDTDKRRLNEALAGGLDKQLGEWMKYAYGAYADLRRAELKEPGVDIAEAKRQVEMVWKDNAMPLTVLLDGQAAKALDAESVYLIALAWQEQAIHLQARVDRDRQAGRPLNPTDVAAARTAWQTTLSWWRTLSTDPSASVLNTAARTLQAEGYVALGDGAAARAILEDLTGDLTPLEKTAHLYMASRIKQ
ncbi:MAG TPA: hypothetical protein VGG61_06225, partial [Gemmataceae bacterium]